MYTSKKLFVRSCLRFALISIFALAVTTASLATASAASPKGSTFSSHTIVKQPSGVKPNAGVRPNTDCEAIAAASTGCPVGINPSLTGDLTVAVGAPSTISPVALNGSGSQHIDFSFPSVVVDTTSTTNGGWTLTATSDGLTVPAGGSTAIDHFLIASTGVGVSCTVVSPPSCSSTANVTPATTGQDLAGGLTYAAVNTGTRDTGSTTITTNVTVPLGATTTAGTASGSITVTAAASV